MQISTTIDEDHDRKWYEDHHERSLLTIPCVVKHRIDDDESPFFRYAHYPVLKLLTLKLDSDQTCPSSV